MEKKYLGSTGLAKFLENLYNVFSQVGHTHTKSQITDFPTIPTKVSQLDNDSGFVNRDENTTYTLTKDGGTITLTGTDGSTMSVEDSDTIISVDSELSDESLNPVQNKVIKSEFDAINALIGEASVEEQIDAAVAGIPQDDWNQNDPSATDYIKNRTHYSEETYVTYFENDALEFTIGAFDYPLAFAMEAMSGQDEIVKITFDGVVYERQVALDENFGTLVAGNKKFIGGEDTGEPFIFMADVCFLAVEEEGTHSVKIEKLKVTYHKIPEEYMPDDLMTRIDYLESETMNLSDNLAIRRADWNAEDINNPEFIKNRPFYEELILTDVVLSLTASRISDTELSLSVNWSDLYNLYSWSGYVRYAGRIVEARVSFSETNGYAYLTIDGVRTSFPVSSIKNVTLRGSGFTEDSYSVEFCNGEIIVHQLDEKYIPDSIISKFDDAIDDALDIVNQSISYKYPTVINGESVWGKMVYGNGKFVNVKANPYAPVYSEDGFNWTETTLPASNCYEIAYGNGKFVIVDNTSVYCSTDAITWTETALSFACGLLTYADGRFVIVSKTRTAYSEDGITWTETTSTLQSDSLLDIAYGNGRFVVVCSHSIDCSEDGITWTSDDSDASSYNGIAYGNGKFVVIGDYPNGNRFAKYSEDGITWKIGNKFYINCSASIAYGGNKFIVLFDEGEATYSEDGINWSSRITLPYSAEYKWDIAYGNCRFIAVSIGSNKIIYSKDGIAWADKIEVLVQNDEDVTFKVRELLKVPEVDNTLSIGNAAADSKIVGDALSLKADKTDILSLRDEFILNSSTEGSTKKFKITIDDDGVLTATEIVESAT